MEYGEVITRMCDLSHEIADARDREDYKTAMALADEIGRLYSPGDHLQASRISYLVQNVGSINYWAGTAKAQIDYRVAMARQFEPPF